MIFKKIATMRGAQDGAIFQNWLLRCSSKGICRVYDLNTLSEGEEELPRLEPICEFVLDRAEELAPHSNAVVFGTEYYAEGDEFPLFYSNIYNNYAKSENKRCGVCCVYRIQRQGMQFVSTMVQLIEVGFTDDVTLWRSSDGTSDVRPYGNFVIDRDQNRLWAFVMRDGDKSTRYFSFRLPKCSEGTVGELGIPKAVLTAEDIQEFFDAPYHHYIQGATCYKGRIYSVEGFGEEIHPAFRMVDLAQKKQIFFMDLYEAGLVKEPEFVDFFHGVCYYGDGSGNLFEASIEETEK